MDNIWERSIPFYRISKSDLIEIFHKYDANLTVLSYDEVSTGCRNSNYVVKTNNGYCFLRIFPPGENGYVNEKTITPIIQDKINVPRLYFTAEFEGRGCLIYKYINSTSLQSICSREVRLDNAVILQVAKSAAVLHNLDVEDFNGLIKIEYPPFSEWYDLFLSSPEAKDRLGRVVVDRVRGLVRDSESKLSEIEKYKSFIHGDFRPANMIIDSQNKVLMVDWEFAGAGHTLADIGQFFRYRSCFDNEHLLVFEKEYNRNASVQLPGNWYEMSRLRDLVNPLQMMGDKAELPLKFQDLKNLIIDTLKYFGY